MPVPVSFERPSPLDNFPSDFLSIASLASMELTRQKFEWH
jgi:hypothetical protein